jgi:ABC-type transport system involved in Fe-S cluster assembly fused permease/ATPase subunit
VTDSQRAHLTAYIAFLVVIVAVYVTFTVHAQRAGATFRRQLLDEAAAGIKVEAAFREAGEGS